MSIVEKQYWYYANDMYELKSTTDAYGDTDMCERNITGPISKEEVYRIVRGTVAINRNTPAWRQQIVARLAAEHFRTQNILEGVGREVGVTWTGFIKSFFTWKTAGKAFLISGSISLVVLGPGFIAKYAPKMAFKPPFSPLGKDRLITYSLKEWGKISGDFMGYISSTSTKITSSCGKLVGGIIVTVGSGMAVCVIQQISLKLFNKLNETAGAKSYKAWQTIQINIFIQDEFKSIPKAFHEDPILRENICPITKFPIRVPCRSKYGHLYEEGAIKAWVVHQSAQGNVPQCPRNNGPLYPNDLEVDTTLSDTIELRLLLLESKA